MDAQLVFINVVFSYLSEHPVWPQKIMHKRVFEFDADFSAVVTYGEISHIWEDNLKYFPG